MGLDLHVRADDAGTLGRRQPTERRSRRRREAAREPMLGGVSLRALLFDFDGLILDTETAELVSWQELWAEHGQSFPLERHLAELGTVGGDAVRWRALEELAGPLDREAVAARRSARKLALIELEQLRPGVLGVLTQARMRGISTAVVSSSSRGWVEGHLGRLACSELFDLIVTGDHDRERGKPQPDALPRGAARASASRPARRSPSRTPPTACERRSPPASSVSPSPTPSPPRSRLSEADLVVDSLAELPWRCSNGSASSPERAGAIRRCAAGAPGRACARHLRGADARAAAGGARPDDRLDRAADDRRRPRRRLAPVLGRHRATCSPRPSHAALRQARRHVRPQDALSARS